MTSILTGWRPAARLARREARRRPWRTLLVVALVGLPVGALTAVLVLGRIGLETPEQQKVASFGQADVSVTKFGTGTWFVYDGDESEAVPAPTAAEMNRLAPRAVTNATSWSVVTYDDDAIVDTDGHLQPVTNIAAAFGDPLLEGKFSLADGSFPSAVGEVAVSKKVADDLGLSIGDTLTLFRQGTVEVVGLAWVPESDNRHSVLLAERGTPHVDGRAVAYVATDGFPQVAIPGWYPAGNDGSIAVTTADTATGFDNTYIEGPFDYGRVEAQHREFLTGAYVLAGLVLLAAAIISSAAFAVGARRQLRTLGLLASNGADTRVLRMAVLFQGTFAGIVGSAAGVAIAISGAAIFYPRMDEIAGRPVNAFAILPTDVIGALALGIAASTIAALVPSRSAAKVPVLAALAGRRPQQRVPNSVPMRGLVITAASLFGLTLWRDSAERSWTAGLALAVVATLGTIAISPWLVGLLEDAASKTSGALRLAARGLARNRVRSGAVVAGILAPMALATFAATAAATTAPNDGGYHPLGDQRIVLAVETPDSTSAIDPALADRLVAVVGDGTQAVDVRVVVPQHADDTSLPGQLVEYQDRVGVAAIATTDLLDAFAVPTHIRDAISESGAVIVAQPYGYVSDGIGETSAYPATEGHDPALRELLASAPDYPGAIPQIHAGYGEVLALVAPQAVPPGRDVRAASTLINASRPITNGEVNEILDIAYGDEDRDAAYRAYLLGERYEHSGLMVQAPSTASGPPFGLKAAAILGSLIVTLAVVAITLSLNAAEEREDDAILAAVGAPPALRRSIRGWQALLLPAMAAALAIPLGVLASRAVFREALVLPVDTIVVIGIAVPLISGLAARLVTSVTLRRPAPVSWLLPA